MTISYTWAVLSLKTRAEGNNNDAVVQTYWKKIGTDEDGNTGEFIGATPFTSTNVPEGQFIPFNQLTEEIVLGWITPVVVGKYEQHVNELIQKQIDHNKIPIVEKRAPWQAEEPASPLPV